MNTEIKKTQREMYVEILDILSEYEEVDHLVEFCEKKIEQIDTKAEKAKAKAAENKEKSDELRDAVEAVLTNELATITDITDAVNANGFDVTTHKVAPRLKALVEAGVAEKSEVKVPGGDGQKARKLVAYKLADAE